MNKYMAGDIVFDKSTFSIMMLTFCHTFLLCEHFEM